MKKIISKSLVLMVGIFLSVLLIAPTMIYAAGPVTSITVTGAGGATTVANGGSLAMSAAVLPADATDSSVTWSVAAGTGTATIAATTGVLTGTGAGTVTVTATANDGSGVTGTKDITITSADVPIYHNTLGIEIGDWTTNEAGESGRQTYFNVWSDCIGQRYRLIISGTGNVIPSSLGDTTGSITDTTWYHVSNFSVILEPGEYTATLYIGNDLNNDNVLEPEEALTYVHSESFTIIEQPQSSRTLDVSPGISGGNTTVSLHGLNAQGSILLWIFKFDGTWDELLEIGNDSDGSKIFQYLVYGTIPDFGSDGSNVDISQLEGFFTIDSNDWYKDVNVILQQGHYFAIVFPIVENTGPDDFLVKEFSINNGTSVPVSTSELVSKKAKAVSAPVVPVVPVWIRTMVMTCYQVWVNSDNAFEMVFWYPYRDNNWVKIYDMSGKEVYSVDMPLDNPHIIVDLPNGMYTVKTFNDDPTTPLQTFVIGK
jgi:hypothetical protein